MPGENYIHDVMEDLPLNGHSAMHRATTHPFDGKSEAVQEIMSKMPSWIIRRGTTVLFFVMMLLFAGAYFIHYPDVIVTSVSIISSNPPVKIVAQANGKIQQMFVKDNGTVIKDVPLCLLENPADYEDVIFLKNVLSRLDTASDLRSLLRVTSFDSNKRLGELQAGYADLYQSINQYLFFIKKDFVSQKLGQLQSQVVYGGRLDKELQNKDLLLKQQLMLERKKFLADSSLVVDKVIAPLEFDNSRKDLISKQMDADAVKTGSLQNKMQQTEYMRTITDLQQQQLQQDNDMQHKIHDNVRRLQGLLDEWKQKYLMKSPVEGKVAFFKFWKENQYVKSGETVLVIVPLVQHYIARSLLPVNGSGKVTTGQKTLIKLYSYPSEEFGMIRGRVNSISAVALDTSYSMEIQLTNGLITTTNKRIDPQPELTGVAEILTSDKSILERLFEKIWIKR